MVPPQVFLKKTSAKLDDDESGDMPLLPTLKDTKARIPKEINDRTGIERTVTKWIYDISTQPHLIDEAVDDVQLLVLKVGRGSGHGFSAHDHHVQQEHEISCLTVSRVMVS